jgi:hypothetical protein
LIDEGVATVVIPTLAFVLRVRAAAPKEARLTNRDECTCDRKAVAYTRSVSYDDP